MILDKELLFSDAQAVTATAVSTNIVDLGPVAAGQLDRDIGQGEPLRLVVICDTTALSTGSSTVTVSIETDDAATFPSATVLYQSAAIAKASITAGARLIDIPLPKGFETFMRLRYTVAVADLTAGAVTAMIVLDSQDNKSYKAAYTA